MPVYRTAYKMRPKLFRLSSIPALHLFATLPHPTSITTYTPPHHLTPDTPNLANKQTASH